MGKRAAAIVGLTEWTPRRVWDEPMFSLDASAKLAAEVLADAGIEPEEVDGLVTPGVRESPMFGPSALAEYLGVRSNFNEVVDLGGATATGMIWRAAAARSPSSRDSTRSLIPALSAPLSDSRNSVLAASMNADTTPRWSPSFVAASLKDASSPIRAKAFRVRDRAAASSRLLANHMVHVTTDARTRPTITPCTTMSATRNMPHGDRS